MIDKKERHVWSRGEKVYLSQKERIAELEAQNARYKLIADELIGLLDGFMGGLYETPKDNENISRIINRMEKALEDKTDG